LSAKMSSTSSSPPKRPKLDPILNCKRRNYISWDDYFMANAVLASERSKDPITQVGAVIVSEDKRIVGTGYNGLPNKCSDDEFPWYKAKQVRHIDEWRKKQDPDFVKHTFVVHAEANAILNKNCADLKNATLYTTLFPCNECAKLIIQAGIKKIYYLSDKLNNSRYASTHSRLMFDAAEIVYTKFEPKINEIVIKLVD
ncbi:hypothetical protein DOY81_004704, partial [Sarcophaga bullata]